MGRAIPTPIAVQLASPTSTMTRIVKFMLGSGVVWGICMTNRDVVYDDGTGPVTYVAANGFDPSTLSTDASYSVDNAEGNALISNDIPGITEEMVETGQLDDAQWICYYVNYNALDAGSHVILDAGDLGQVTVKEGVIYTPELLSFMMRLKQTIGGTWSRTCRAVFGSPAASQTGCGVDAEALWQNFAVTTVGAEDDRTFDLSGASGDFFPGRVQWLTGDNAGLLCAVEEQDSDGTISLIETTPYAIAPGDTGRIRIDCDKTKTMCVDVHNNYPNMKAEDTIPVGEAGSISVPGAQA